MPTRWRARMRSLAIGCWLAPLVFAAGCDQKARDFAVKTKAILDQRSDQLSKKIGAENTAYNNFAAHAAEADRALVDSSLRNERNERSRSLAVDYVERRRSAAHWRTDLAEYARIDHT